MTFLPFNRLPCALGLSFLLLPFFGLSPFLRSFFEFPLKGRHSVWTWDLRAVGICDTLLKPTLPLNSRFFSSVQKEMALSLRGSRVPVRDFAAALLLFFLF